MPSTHRVSRLLFDLAFQWAREHNPLVAEMTSDTVPLGEDSGFYLTADLRSGYVLTDGELTNLFSLVRGRGHDLVAQAVVDGATRLDCFEGYLPALYSAHGFVVDRVEDNYDGPEYPSVVYMRREV